MHAHTHVRLGGGGGGGYRDVCKKDSLEILVEVVCLDGGLGRRRRNQSGGIFEANCSRPGSLPGFELTGHFLPRIQNFDTHTVFTDSSCLSCWVLISFVLFSLTSQWPPGQKEKKKKEKRRRRKTRKVWCVSQAERERERQRQTDRQRKTDRQTDRARQTDKRDRDRQADRVSKRQRQSERDIDRWTDRVSKRERDRWMDGQTDRQTDRQTENSVETDGPAFSFRLTSLRSLCMVLPLMVIVQQLSSLQLCLDLCMVCGGGGGGGLLRMAVCSLTVCDWHFDNFVWCVCVVFLETRMGVCHLLKMLRKPAF